MSPPSKGAKVLIAMPLAFELRVIKPSGVGVDKARVEIEWDFQNPYDDIEDVQVVETNDEGVAHVPVLDPGKRLSDTEITGTLKVSKRHHGPIIGQGETFKNAPARIRVKYEPNVTPPLQVLGLSTPARVLWGRPRATGPLKNKLEVVLMEGGTLGRAHPGVRTRRLSSPGRTATPPTPQSQIDEEILYHIAHGELALTQGTDYQIEHDPDVGDFDDCVAGRCSAALPPYTGGKAKGISKVSARHAVVGGLRMAHINDFPDGTKIKLTGPGDPANLNPRLMVGMIRLCRLLSTASIGGLPIRTFITVGFGRPGEDRAHGNGRGVDFSGASTEHTAGLVDRKDANNKDPLDPNCRWPLSGRRNVFQTIACIAEQDFVVYYHWGLVKRLVREASGAIVRRAFNDKKTYLDAYKPSSISERLLYSLSVLPAEAERRRGHTLTDAHYVQAGELFQGIYEFFAAELSQRNAVLGPLPPQPPVPASPPKPIDLQWADDLATTEPTPGEVGGRTLHPDTPEPDLFDANGRLVKNSAGRSKRARRHSHVNHIHANVGPMKDTPGSHFER